MNNRFFARFARLLICLTFLTSLPACVSRLTLAEVHQINEGAEIAQSCVRAPIAASDADIWAHNASTRQSRSNGDPGFAEFVKTAHTVYLYDPNMPRARSSTLPWPYQRMTCESHASDDVPPLPKGMEEIPLTHASREALVSSLAQECTTALSDLEGGYDKRFLGQFNASQDPNAFSRRKFSTERVEEIGQMLRDVIRGILPKVPAGTEPSDGQISIIDTKTGQVVGGLGVGTTASLVPGGTAMVDEANRLRPATRELLLGAAGAEMVSGLVQIGIGAGTDAAGVGLSGTGVGAPAGVALCATGTVIATNGAISFCHGAKTLMVVVCNWNRLPKAADAQPLAATALGPNSPGTSPPAGQTTPAPAAKPAGQTTPAPAAKPATSPAKPAATPNTSTGQPKQAPGAQPGSGKQPSPKAKPLVVCTGQWHHAISKRIHDALQGHDTLKNVYKYRDNRFVTQAIDKKAHNGYEKWHKAMESQVLDWLTLNGKATPAKFEEYLRDLYRTNKELAPRFPNGL